MGAILGRKAPRTWERPRMRDFREVETICDFTEEPWIQKFGMTHLTFGMLCDAGGPPAVPVTSSSWEPSVFSFAK